LYFLFTGGLVTTESKLEKTGLKLQKEKKYNEAIGCFTEAIVSDVKVYARNFLVPNLNFVTFTKL